jgi:hypothetical protein
MPGLQRSNITEVELNLNLNKIQYTYEGTLANLVYRETVRNVLST